MPYALFELEILQQLHLTNGLLSLLVVGGPFQGKFFDSIHFILF